MALAKRLLVVALIAGLTVPAVADIRIVTRNQNNTNNVAEMAATAVTGCTNAVLYGDASQVLGCEAALSYNAGTNTLTAGTVNATASTITNLTVSDNIDQSTVGSIVPVAVTLTESAATTVATIPVADNSGVGGVVALRVYASDGTEHQNRFVELKYAVVNESDTETCGLSGTDQTDDGNVSAITAGTLTYAWTCVAGTNSVTIKLNAVSSLTQTTLNVRGHIRHAGVVLP